MTKTELMQVVELLRDLAMSTPEGRAAFVHAGLTPSTDDPPGYSTSRPKFGVVGVADGKPDEWVLANFQRWYADTMARAQEEADERNKLANLGLEAFVGRFWQPMEF
jgi:hypothetical protein